MRSVLRSIPHGLLLPLAAVLGLAGCAANATLSDMWKDPQAPGPMQRMFVIAVKKIPAQRRIMEDAFVSALAKQGVTAEPSYREFPDAVPDTDQVITAVERGGYDGVLSVSRLESSTESNYVPGYVTTESRSRYNRWSGRYHTYFVNVEHPGYTETERVLRHQVDVWDPREGQLVWTAVGGSINPSNATDVNKDLVSKVVPELVKQGILPKR